MKALVTGAAGFIGSHFVRMLLDPAQDGERHTVTAVDSLTYAGNRENLAPVRDHPGLRFEQADVRDAALLDRLVAGHDTVVHFAAESHVDRSIDGARDFVLTNVLGTQSVLDAALRHGARVVYVSTDEVYGSIATGSWPEEHPLRPNSPYAASKASGDLLAQAYHRTHGLDVRITRCSNNYGPYQYPEKIIPLFVTNLLRGLTVPLYGDGMNARDWLHVDDHCRGILLALRHGRPGEVYNIGGGTELTNRELTDLLLKACGAGPERIEYVADRKGHDRRYSVDWSKARRELGYEPRRDFTAGLAETVRWYRENSTWWEPLLRRPAR
ncbi:dTDP-glucose 4,6-dehydratase [Streptomyces camelliae]|uniref:dTDP-glucose 4,6-dehydratase n=1 Tax=Streptomyces camelliae TaxID=3004093 RepID=A0ABY7PGG7_9ACTN|nr:dTDP-glucose 4,6-dehydratase [Streptomyces sp. HUAS 2-6]WBO69729.1 dTDP-glucose 4,6-dehydratase [Streptomyces sp. HUAS 2-6]